MEYTEKVIYQSNYWYNDGLKKANIRDLSGAITSLKRSLQFYSDNIAARNLLGLVYYGRGEVIEGLVEWILSANLRPEDNIAIHYIRTLQEDRDGLQIVNGAIKKYNLSLDLARQGSDDLAIIQLTQAVKEHPTFVKAYQLLALIYIRKGDKKEAKDCLRVVHSLDKTDERTLRYTHELTELGKEQNRVRRMPGLHVQKSKNAVSYANGNDTIIQPVLGAFKESTRLQTLFNIIVGAVIGIAVMLFLIMPGVIYNNQKDLNKQILQFSEDIATKDTQINALKKELSVYVSDSDTNAANAATAETTRQSYEIVLSIYQHYQANDMSDFDMVSQLVNVLPDALGESTRAQYDEMASTIYPRSIERMSADGRSAFDAGNYPEAINQLSLVVRMDQSAEEGAIYLLLAEAYEKSGDSDNAKQAYETIAGNLGGTEAATTASAALERLQ